MLTTFPIYILDLDDNDQVVFPDGKADISHLEFWEETAAAIVTEHFAIPLEPLKNLPYSQRRARISSNGLVYYGKEQSSELLETIAATVGESGLKWAFDEHEQRLEFDLMEFEELLVG